MVKQWLHQPRVLMICAGLLTSLCLFIALSGILSEKTILADQSGTVQSSQLSKQRTQRKRDGYRATYDEYQHNTQNIAAFRQEFLRQKDERILDISRLLSELAVKHHVSLDQVRYTSQPLPNQNLGLYRIDFPANAAYADLRKFISDLENSPLLLMITQLELEESNQFQSTVRAKFRLATFFEERAP